MAADGFEQVVALHDRRSGLRAFLAIHDTERGPAFGGVRRWVYRDEHEALRDCLRLARAMTQKCVALELPAGGAKLVLLDHPGMSQAGCYRAIGVAVERLAGRFYTGPDVGTGPEQLAWIAAETSYVTDPGPDGPGELAESTATGVFHGIAEVLRHLDGHEDWPRRTVVIQGLGAVGARLAALLVERDVKVFASDIDTARARRVARATALELVDPAAELDVPCDVFAPCALGGILHDLSLGRLRCRAIVGAANNVLAHSHHADRLHERGVLLAPDFIVSAGALIRGTIFHLEGRREPVGAIGERVGAALGRILARARDEDAPPVRVAERDARERIERWRVRAVR